MARYLFEIQHTGSAFGVCIPERAWRRLSAHTTLSAARKRFSKERDDMRRICGPSAHNDHFRILPLADTPMRYRFYCQGSHRYEHAPGCQETTTVSVVWKAGEPEPDPVPEQWPSAHMCPACAKLADEEVRYEEVCCG